MLCDAILLSWLGTKALYSNKIYIYIHAEFLVKSENVECFVNKSMWKLVVRVCFVVCLVLCFRSLHLARIRVCFDNNIVAQKKLDVVKTEKTI